jgi:hypothetical protein
VVGTAANGDNDYASQIATINSFTSDSEYYQEGDETYNPLLVEYNFTRLTNMIDTMKTLADAMDQVTAETGAEGRYGDPQVIASDYEKYIYGTSAYVLSEIAKGTTQKKTVAVVTAINEDGTFTIANADSMAATSSVRFVEYTALVSNNLANILDKTTVTAEELSQADAIITTNVQDGSITVDSIDYDGASDYLTKITANYGKSPMIITTSPNALYGITMNSVENAMGLGYIVGYLYSDVLNISPVDMCAYFYENFYHISNRNSLATVVQTNFGDVILPDGISGTLSSSYSAEAVEKLLAQGMLYYQNNPEAFEGTYIAEADWEIDWTQGIGAGLNKTSQSITGVNDSYTKTYGDAAFSLGAKAETTLSYASDNTKVATVDKNGKVTIKGVGTAKITITAAGTDSVKEATKTVTVTVNKAAQSITLSKTSYTKTYGDAAFSLGAKAETTLSYASDNTKVATVDKNGKVTIKGAGTATITVKAAATSTVKAATSKTVKITVNKAAQSITLNKTSYSKTYGNAAFSLGAKAQGKLSYTSSNKKVATVDANGKVTIKGAGTATITVKAATTSNYEAAKNKTVKVTVAKASQTITAKKSTASYKASALAKKAQTFTIGASAKTAVSYKVASGSKYISVSKAGVVTVKKGTKAGTYKITVTAAANTNYKAATKTITVTVK